MNSSFIEIQNINQISISIHYVVGYINKIRSWLTPTDLMLVQNKEVSYHRTELHKYSDMVIKEEEKDMAIYDF